MLEEFLRSWVPLLVSIIALGTAGWNIITGPAGKLALVVKDLSKTVGEDVKTLDRRMDKAESDINTITTELRHLPDREATHRLEMAVQELNGRMGILDERLKPVAAISERMQEMMLAESRRSGAGRRAPE